jgi:hypothetical protein
MLRNFRTPLRAFRLVMASLFVLLVANTQLNAQCQTCCNGSKPKSLILLYNGVSCSASVTCQAADKWSCTGAGAGNAATVYITASKNADGSGGTYFAGSVNLNSEFTANSAAGGSSTFPSNTFFNVYSSQGGSLLQAVKIHTSCSTPLVAGDQLGSFKIQKITLEDNTVCNAPAPPPPPPTCPTPVITINNTSSNNVGPVCKNQQVIYKTTDLGYSCMVYNWSFGANATPSTATGIGPHTVIYSTVGNPTVTLIAKNNCIGGVGSTICPPPPPPPMGSDCCPANSGKPKSIKLKYTGQSCSTTNTTQSTDKYSCSDVGSGPNGASSVYIIANEKADGSGVTYFSGTVNLNGSFTATSPSSTLPSNTFLIVKASQSGAVLQNLKIHTSCSAPIVPGESFGSLLLESATWSTGATCDVNSGGGSGNGGPDCCDSNSGKPKSLVLKYNGGSCSQSNTVQPTDKYSCDDYGGGPNNAQTVYIKANEKADGTGASYFTGTVNLDGTFTVTATSSTFPSNTYFLIYNNQGGTLKQLVKIHTSCSAPIVSGDKFGSLTLLAATWPSGVTCGSVTPPGPDCIDCNKSTTVTVTVQDCICVNQGGDTDGDGVCNNVDCAPNDPNFPKPAGTPCNDGNPNTTNDVIQADGCSCAGTSVCNLAATFTVPNGCLTQSFLIFADANDPYFPPNNPNYTYSYNIQPANTVAGLFTIDPRSVTATFNAPGLKTVTATITNPAIPNCQIVKTTSFTVSDCIPCANQGGDSDGDGVCNNVDCQPNNPAFPATPGTPCNDGNPNTTNDVVQTDGCSCAGTPTSTCNVSVNGCVITITGLNASSSAKIFSSNWNILFDCNPWAGNACGSNISFTVPSNGTYWVQACGSTTSYTISNCTSNPCANQGGDSDGDGVCNNQDCQPNNPAFPATPGTPCNDGNPNTINDVVTANGCGCAGTPTQPCDNITAGGTIGFGNSCASSISVPCNTASLGIANCVSPSGGSGTMETIWLKSHTSCSPPTSTAADVMAGLDPHWVVIPGATSLTFNPGTITQNTCYLRCTRRAGCPNFIESNIISLTTDCGTGTPNCANITITASSGKITVGNLGAAPFASVKIFNSNWGTVYSCYANCSGATVTVNVPTGTYFVYAGYVGSNYNLICETNKTVTVPGGDPCANLGGDSDGDGVCNNLDCAPNNPALPKPAGTACNDGNANTTNDVIQADGCTCAGTPVTNPCANLGGDSDGDGVCNNNDCQPNNPAYPATPGTPCNDNNANTNNDVVTADGCGCAGTPVNQGCTATTLVTYSMQACNSCSGSNSPSDWSELTPTISGNGGCTGLTATTISPKVSGTEHSCTPRSNGNALCTGAGNTLRFSMTLPNGGDLSGLSFYEQAPAQYVWSSTSNTNCSGTNTGTNNPPTKFDLKVFKGNTQVFSQTYNTQSTWNLRNVSFAGINAFSTTGSTTYTFEFTPHTATGSGSVKAWDIDEIAVMGCCGSTNNGGTPNCANISITPGAGKVTVSGLNGASVTSLQVFNSTWTATLFTCFGNCSATQTVTLPAGSYQVLAKYYNSSWQPICEKSQLVNVVSALQGDQNEYLNFVAQKEEDFTSLLWTHNGSFAVEEYIVERSDNGNGFAPLNALASKGGQSQELYEDFDLEPVTGDNYYRLKMIYTDGSIGYSDVQKVTFVDLTDYVLFPNPANGFVKASLENVIGAEDVNITIFNSLGVEIKRFQLDEVYSKFYQMDIRDLHEGQYIVWFNVPGKRPVAKLLVVGRI